MFLSKKCESLDKMFMKDLPLSFLSETCVKKMGEY
jgi:hypothetical protein